MPLVSVLTIVRNGQDTLPGTIRSVLSQTYPNIEYVIVDGASTDRTMEIIRGCDGDIDRWISEPDRGTSDAINKAISLARGEYVSWLGSGDWFDADFIETAVSSLVGSGADYVFGDLRIYRDDVLVQLVKGDLDSAAPIAPEVHSVALPSRVTRTSPSMVTKRACFEHVGLFELNYKIRNDFEWILRLHLHGATGLYDSRLVGHFRLGGLSDKGGDFTHIFENLRILRRHRLLTPSVAAPHVGTLIRYSTGYLARLLMPKMLHRTLRRMMRRGDSVLTL